MSWKTGACRSRAMPDTARQTPAASSARSTGWRQGGAAMGPRATASTAHLKHTGMANPAPPEAVLNEEELCRAWARDHADDTPPPPPSFAHHG